MMNRYKKFLLIVLPLLFLGIGSIGVFNYTIDRAGLFHTDNIMQQAGKELLKGNIVAGLGDEAFDDRTFQILLVQAIQKRVDIIAIGSSRTKELRERYLENGKYTFYNHAVNHANLEDYIAILGAYKKFHNYLPKEVILGVDPWILNANSGRNLYKRIEEYNEFSDQIFHTHTEQETDKLFFLNKIKSLFSYSYTLSNLRFLIQQIRRKPFYVTKTIKTDDYLREPDASIWYPYAIRYPDTQKVRRKALQYTKGAVYSLENFQYKNRKEKFEKFIHELRKEGVHVTLFLAPYHPLTYDILIKNPKYHLNAVEEYFHQFAKTNQLQIIGSYNPQKLGLIQEDFFDGMHCRFNAMEKIFSSWKPADAL